MDTASLYNILAQGLIATCPDGFTEAKIAAVVEDDWTEKSYRCSVGGNWTKGLSSPAEADFAVDDALHDLRKQMTLPGAEPWSKCTFTLFPDGQFKFDVEYDD